MLKALNVFGLRSCEVVLRSGHATADNMAESLAVKAHGGWFCSWQSVVEVVQREMKRDDDVVVKKAREKETGELR